MVFFQQEIEEALVDARPSSNGWSRANCPVCEMSGHSKDTKLSLGIHESGGWHCFRCLNSGFIGEKSSEPTIEPILPIEEDELPSIDLPDEFIPLWGNGARESIRLRVPVTYLLSRGFDEDIWEKAKIGVCLNGFYFDRIIVPVFDFSGEKTLGFVARLWRKEKEDELRYRYPKGMKRGSILYEEHLLYEVTDEPLLIVEGIMDALSFYGRACALFGKPSAKHKQLLLKANRPLAIMLDADAFPESWALSSWLKLEGKQANVIKLPPGQDPNTVNKDYVQEQIIKLF